MTDVYYSIASPSRGLFRDNGSRFIALAYPVETVAEVKAIVEGLKKEYHDARHHCFAYRLGHTGEVFRASDDGEPAGSAGRQILAQMNSASLSDVLVVVVRYFGGIKLGIPGLIRAYRASTSEALEKAGRVEKVASKLFMVTFPYLSMNAVMKTVKDLSLTPSGQEFGSACRMELRVRLSSEDIFRSRLSVIDGAQMEEIV